MVKLLHQKLNEELNIFNVVRDVPPYIEDNLKNPLRDYQLEALSYFIQTQKDPLANVTYQHLLFRMATGAGKTNVLASTILYMFGEHKYTNFLFFVNSDAVLKKTYDNFFNIFSSKYLFKDSVLSINGERIEIKEVEQFPVLQEPNTIYLKLTSIQRLHMELRSPSENNISIEDMDSLEIVLLSDEAHHINASTKSSKKSNHDNKTASWEKSIVNLLDMNKKNRLLEFTATINLENKELQSKYKDKIVFNYDLREFMVDRYSKNVGIIRSTESDNSKLLTSILLSQYRKLVAFEHGIELKPVILFKSNSIKTSLESHQNFNQLLNKLTSEELKDFINERLIQSDNKNLFLNKMYEYYLSKNLSKILSDLKFDFRDENLLNANDKEFLSVQNTTLLNSLEDRMNNIRGIFAVAKLNEGWDVLNLFDIVRISEGATSSKNSTDSEAQLIGRGARYYPYTYLEKKDYQRRFDFIDSPLKILEKLHYHTSNENAYIKNLNKSLEAADILIQEDEYTTYYAKLKKEIVTTDFYKSGKLYVNKTHKLSQYDYTSLKAYGIHSDFEYHSEEVIEQEYLSGVINKGNFTKIELQLNIEERVWRKALLRNRFYQFSNLKNYIPVISSIDEFIKSAEFLGGIKAFLITAKGLEKKFLNPTEKIKIADYILEKIAGKIKNNFLKEVGTTNFYPISINEILKDYTVNVGKYRNPTFNEIIDTHPMKKNKWYIYDNAIVNGLELRLINYIESIMDQIYLKYGEVYLIRNEKKFKLVEFDGVKGFMPDFLLYLKENDVVYQIIIEPKADVLMAQDDWKQTLMLSLTERDDIEVLGEDAEVKIIGIKFFSETPKYKSAFREDLYEKLKL